MSVQNVVLGQLVRRRGYGYEIADRLRGLFDDVFGFSGTAVYPALTALEKKGLIVEVDREPLLRAARWSHPRVVYEATAAGREHFRRWMEQPPRKTPLREELHMKLILAQPGDVPALLDALRAVEDQCHAQLARIVDRAPGDGPPLGARSSAFGSALVQDGVVAHLRTTLEWSQRSRGALQQLTAASGDAPPRQPDALP
jgi:DNA-binding PadR family transcriptional regulator